MIFDIILTPVPVTWSPWPYQHVPTCQTVGVMRLITESPSAGTAMSARFDVA